MADPRRNESRIHSVIEYAQAPIAPGSRRCVRFSGGARADGERDLKLGLGDVSFLVDVQLESTGRHPVFRHRSAGRAIGLDLDRRPEGVTAHMWLGEGSNWYCGSSVLSETTGKRLAIRVAAADRVAMVDELQPWGPPTTDRILLRPGSGFGAGLGRVANRRSERGIPGRELSRTNGGIRSVRQDAGDRSH